MPDIPRGKFSMISEENEKLILNFLRFQRPHHHQAFPLGYLLPITSNILEQFPQSVVSGDRGGRGMFGQIPKFMFTKVISMWSAVPQETKNSSTLDLFLLHSRTHL